MSSMTLRAWCTGRAALSVLAVILAGAWSISAAPATSATTAENGHADAYSAAAWPQFHAGAAKTGWNRLEQQLSVRTVHRLQQRWTVANGDLTGSPIIVGSRAFVVTIRVDNQGQDVSDLVAVDRTSGQVLWTAPLGGSPTFPPGALAYADGLVLVVADGVLEGYQANTGTLAWTMPVGNSRGPTVSGTTVYLGSSDWLGSSNNFVYAISATDMTTRWKTQLSDPVDSVVTVANGRVFAVAGEQLVALNAATGSILWHAVVGNVYGGGAAVSNGTVYVAANVSGEGGAGQVVAVNAQTGRRLWTANAGDADVQHSVPAVDSQRVYIGDINGEVHAYSAENGAPLWTRSVGGEIWSSIATANGVIYFGIDTDKAFALNARTGSILRSITPASSHTFAAMASPAVVNGMLYVGYGTAGLRAYRLPH